MENQFKNHSDSYICFFFHSLHKIDNSYKTSLQTQFEWRASGHIKTNTLPEKVQKLVDEIVEEYNFRFGNHYKPFAKWSDKQLKKLYKTLIYCSNKKTHEPSIGTFTVLKKQNVIDLFIPHLLTPGEAKEIVKQQHYQDLWKMLKNKYFVEVESRRLNTLIEPLF